MGQWRNEYNRKRSPYGDWKHYPGETEGEAGDLLGLQRRTAARRERCACCRGESELKDLVFGICQECSSHVRCSFCGSRFQPDDSSTAGTCATCREQLEAIERFHVRAAAPPERRTEALRRARRLRVDLHRLWNQYGRMRHGFVVRCPRRPVLSPLPVSPRTAEDDDADPERQRRFAAFNIRYATLTIRRIARVDAEEEFHRAMAARLMRDGERARLAVHELAIEHCVREKRIEGNTLSVYRGEIVATERGKLVAAVFRILRDERALPFKPAFSLAQRVVPEELGEEQDPRHLAAKAWLMHEAT